MVSSAYSDQAFMIVCDRGGYGGYAYLGKASYIKEVILKLRACVYYFQYCVPLWQGTRDSDIKSHVNAIAVILKSSVIRQRDEARGKEQFKFPAQKRDAKLSLDKSLVKPKRFAAFTKYMNGKKNNKATPGFKTVNIKALIFFLISYWGRDG